jgi:nucleoside-diphosphate-sugar epimerase
LKLPTAALKLSAPIGPVIGPIMGFNPNFREMVSASDGVSYLASDAKARAELGFAPRSLDDGLHELVGR